MKKLLAIAAMVYSLPFVWNGDVYADSIGDWIIYDAQPIAAAQAPAQGEWIIYYESQGSRHVLPSPDEIWW